MTKALHGTILFGPQPDLALPGYLVISGVGRFAKARAAGQDHFIRDVTHAYELWPCDYDGKKTPHNPLGEVVRPKSQPAYIAKP